MEENRFEKIATFQYSSEAIIYQGKLESEGIEVFLRDNFTVESNPLYSNAVGGIKLFVKSEDAERAKEVLSDVNAFSVDDSGKLIQCPNCGAENTEMVTSITGIKELLSFVFSFLVILLPFHAKHKYKCAKCNFEFSEK